MNPSICAGSMPRYGWATYRTGTPRSGKMSRDIRWAARKPANETARTIIKSEIGRRNANDTKFILMPQPALPRPHSGVSLDRPNKSWWYFFEKCGAYFRPNAQPLEVGRPRVASRAWTENRLGMPGVC